MKWEWNLCCEIQFERNGCVDSMFIESEGMDGWMNEGVFDLCCCFVGGLKRFLLFAD